MLRRLCYFIGVATLLFASFAGAAPPERFPIIAWSGVPENHTTLERYKELADCGFTHSFSSFSDLKSLMRALDVAKQVDVRLLVNLPALQKDPEGTVKALVAHPALGGYYLRDEPSRADFAELGAWVKRIQAVDAEHPCVINLFPTYATPGQLGARDYQTHVDQFIREVPVPLISFDHYPIVGEGVRGDWHQNLEIIRSASAASGKPFWAFCLSVAHNPYPLPTITHLRLQAFTNLAYGAQGIQYFTYWTPGDTSTWNFHEGPIAADGKRTKTYDVVKQANEEIQGLASVFVGARVESVGYVGAPPPAGGKAFLAVGPIKSIEAKGAGVLVSMLSKGAQRFLVIVNRDLKQTAAVNIGIDSTVEVSGAGKSRVVRGEPVSVDPGDIYILSWPAR
jgi:hypothetical protein